MAKRVAIFRASFCDLPIGAEQKWTPEICPPFFKSSTFFKKNIRLSDAIQGYGILRSFGIVFMDVGLVVRARCSHLAASRLARTKVARAQKYGRGFQKSMVATLVWRAKVAGGATVVQGTKVSRPATVVQEAKVVWAAVRGVPDSYAI